MTCFLCFVNYVTDINGVYFFLLIVNSPALVELPFVQNFKTKKREKLLQLSVSEIKKSLICNKISGCCISTLTMEFSFT